MEILLVQAQEIQAQEIQIQEIRIQEVLAQEIQILAAQVQAAQVQEDLQVAVQEVLVLEHPQRLQGLLTYPECHMMEILLMLLMW